LTFAVKLLNQAIYDRMMKCLTTSWRFELFENIIHMELDSTFLNNETLCNISIAMSIVLVRLQGETILVSVTVDDCSNGRVPHDYCNVEFANELILHE
jgi:hypothetical protein